LSSTNNSNNNNNMYTEDVGKGSYPISRSRNYAPSHDASHAPSRPISRSYPVNHGVYIYILLCFDFFFHKYDISLCFVFFSITSSLY
jgi:hypothetical protein